MWTPGRAIGYKPGRRGKRTAKVGRTLQHLRRIRLRDYFTTAVILALTLVLIGVGLLYWASQMPKHPHAGTVIREVGAVMLAIGVLDLLHQIFLQRDLAQDLLQVVGVKTSIASLNLEEITQDEPKWESFFAVGREFSLLPIDPVSWMRTSWKPVLEAARSRQITVSLYVPAPNSSHVPLLAHRLGVNPAGLPADLQAATDGVFDAWRHDGNLRKGCTLNIVTYDDLPGYGLAIADEVTIIHLRGTTGMSLGDPAFTSIFSKGRDGAIGRWCDGQLQGLNGLSTQTYTVP